eukprot:m.136805 g.136805  ORF g.136805 m.136805 type:complete len:687 (-) comp10967_c0_seq1:243-2303(-)
MLLFIVTCVSWFGVGLFAQQNETTSCVPTPCVSLSSCSLVNGLATCSSCPSGYFGDGRIDGTGCKDINECDLSANGVIVPPVCDSATSCTNTVGSFVCGDCPPEYHGTGSTGCVRVPSIDVNDDNVIINVDKLRDVKIASGSNAFSLRQAIIKIKNTEEVVSFERELLQETSNFAESTHSNLMSHIVAADADLSSNIVSISSSFELVYSTVELSTESLAKETSVELSRSHSTLSSGIGQLETEFGNLEDDFSLFSSEASSSQSSLLSFIVDQSKVNVMLVQSISMLSASLSSFTSCSSQGMLFNGEDCVKSCVAIGDCDTECKTSAAGTLRFRDESLEYCDGSAYVSPSASTFGLLPFDPAMSCAQLQDVDFGTGKYYIGEIGTAALHYCDMTTTPATDYGGDGTTIGHPSTSCTILNNQFSFVSTQKYYFKIGNVVSLAFCDATTKMVVPNGEYKEFAALSCKQIDARYPISGQQEKWIKGNSVAAFKVTCEGANTVMTVKASDFSPTGYIVSQATNNNWYKCRCANALSRLSVRTSTWYIGVVPAAYATSSCNDFHEIEYTSASFVLSLEQVKYLSTIADNKNFNVISTSCDDDNVAYPGGHWLGFELTLNSNNYVAIDCTSADGGGAQTDPTSATANNVGCCDVLIGNQFDTYPFPTKVCASLNTGGGISLTFSTSTLKFSEA